MHKNRAIGLLVITLTLFSFLTASIVLAQSGRDNASPLIKKLIYSNEDIKDIGRKELNALDPTAKAKLIPELLVALKYFNKDDRNQVVTRYRAAETLGILGPVAKDTATDLIETMKKDESDVVRSHAATALGKLGLEPEKITPILLDAMNDKKIWLESAKAMADLGPKAIPALTEAIKSNNKAIQIGAAVALGEMGPIANEASPALEQAIKSTKDRQTKDSFRVALNKIGPLDVIMPYDNKKSPVVIPDEVVFLSPGPVSPSSLHLRFILRVEDIYYSIVIDVIKLGTTGEVEGEGTPSVVAHSFVINDVDIKRATGLQELTEIQFKQWIKWNEFELDINGQRYRVQYTAAQKFRITASKNK
jgi:hypothetical protein